jgi:hypothetical protein
MLAEARRPSCPHHATRLTSPTKSGPSSNRCLSGPKGATDPQLARAPGRGRRRVLLAEERLLPREFPTQGRPSTTTSAAGGGSTDGSGERTTACARRSDAT